MSSPLFLRPFDVLPLRQNSLGGVHFLFAKHVRMSANQFVHNVTAHLVEIESAPLLGQLAVEHDLEQQITELLHHFVVIAGFDRIEQFVNFFDRVEAQTHMVLLKIPWASSYGGTELGHDRQ